MISLHAHLRRIVKAISVGAAAPLCSLAASGETALPPARDLAADALAVARSGMPLIVMVSLPGCPHCEVVRRSHLLPLLRTGNATQTSLIRQVEINGQATLRDFSGRFVTHADFASRYQIKVAPVVMFFGVGGEQLAAPLVGSMIPDFYGAYLDVSLAEAKAKLKPTGGN